MCKGEYFYIIILDGELLGKRACYHSDVYPDLFYFFEKVASNIAKERIVSFLNLRSKSSLI